MGFFRWILESLHALPEKVRLFLAGAFLCVIAVGLFIMWGAVTAEKLASVSGALTGTNGAASQKSSLDDTKGIFAEIGRGLRDMRALFSSGIFSLPTVPSATSSAASQGPASPPVENGGFENMP